MIRNEINDLRKTKPIMQRVANDKIDLPLDRSQEGFYKDRYRGDIENRENSALDYTKDYDYSSFVNKNSSTNLG